MTGRLPGRNDPFEGRGAIRTRRRQDAEGMLALGLAVIAAGLTAAAWLRLLLPFVS
jgi:hypothetical protein